MSAIWKMKSGEKIKIKDMSDSHLLNTMRLLIRSAVHKRVATERCYLFPAFGGPTGEMAQDAFDQEFNQVLEMTTEDYLPEIYEEMEEEAGKRKLNLPEMPDEALVGVLALKL